MSPYVRALHHPAATQPTSDFRWSLTADRAGTRACRWLAVAALVGLVAMACDDDSRTNGGGATNNCDGRLIAIDGDEFCVYEGTVIVEEGFTCPGAWPNLMEFGGLGICAEDEEVSDEILEQVDREYREREQLEQDFVAVGEGCDDPAPLQINVEPVQSSEEYIVLLVDGSDVDTIAGAMADFYGFTVIEVFGLVTGFSASLSPDVVEAIRCNEGVVRVEQSRTDTPPPDGCRSRADCTTPGHECFAASDPNVCGIPPMELCFSDSDCGDNVCHAIPDGCSPDGVGSECRPACSSDDDCAGYVCDQGRCRPPACDTEGAVCGELEVCQPETLVQTGNPASFTDGCDFVRCATDTDCVGDDFCVKGACQPTLGNCAEPMAVP